MATRIVNNGKINSNLCLCARRINYPLSSFHSGDKIQQYSERRYHLAANGLRRDKSSGVSIRSVFDIPISTSNIIRNSSSPAIVATTTKLRCGRNTQSRMIATQAEKTNNGGDTMDTAVTHKAYIALGSNIGDRIAMIERACAEMNKVGIKVKRTSSLFETAPMYVLDQEPFLNGACEVETTLGPIELLDTLQTIENGLGRRKLIDKGPRNIDLDILLYDNEKVSHPRLNIPHKLMMEREFVLRPLCQLIPHERVPLPGMNLTYLSALRSLPPSETVPIITSPLSPHIPPLTPSNPKKKTIIMAILNVTPDSFSDGGKHFYHHYDSDQQQYQENLTSTIRDFISAGATIIDVGGESTRPNATKLTEEEELSRVIPVIKFIRSLPEAANIAISIDTYRARVAAAACQAGADIVNDVSAGTLDPEMLSTIASIGKSVILMHMRGTPSTMTKLTTYPNGVIRDVGTELLTQLHAAEEAGIPRWRIILDPGLGFAKTGDQNVELLRGFHPHLTHQTEGLDGFPWLIGTSRKAYIGHITGVEKASERVWGTAAAVTASVAQGADIVRVHDVREMGQVVRMADAIYRF